MAKKVKSTMPGTRSRTGQRRTSGITFAQLERDEFLRLALRYGESGSGFEDRVFEDRIHALVNEHLDRLDDTEIEAALSQLDSDDVPPGSYESFLNIVEDCAESHTTDKGSAVLFLIPLFCWSRYGNPVGRISNETLIELGRIFKETLTSGADAVDVRMGSHLLTAEHLPETLTSVRKLLDNVSAGSSQVVDISYLADTAAPADFADTRYLVLTARSDKPTDLMPDASLSYVEWARRQMQFCMRAHDALEMDMIGSVYEVLPATSFYTAWRQAEAAMHVFCLKALVDFVHAMGLSPSRCVATVALFTPTADTPEDDASSEIRIGISSVHETDKVVAGVAWRASPDEFEQLDALARDVLRSKDLTTVYTHQQSFPLEWCEDCGAPLYANPEGLVVHIDEPHESLNLQMPPTLN